MDLTAGTRGEILKRLKSGGPTTAGELSRALGTAPNAIRTHLALLEQGGLIEAHWEKRKRGRPAKVYGLTPHSEGLFPRHYDQLLEELIGELRAADGPDKLGRLVTGMAGRWAERLAPGLQGLDFEARLAELVRHLDLGDLMPRLKKEDEGFYTLVVFNCVYLNTARSHREVCRLIPTVIERLTGAKVTHGPTVHQGRSHCEYWIERRD